MITIIDYGAGNLFSVKNALDFLGVEHEISSDPAAMERADALILPGVGAFPDAMWMLNDSGLTAVIQKQAEQKPLLGICLGMQLLFETGFEFTKTAGLGLIPGVVQKIDGGGLKIPHMGWNELTIARPCALTADLQQGDYVYFVHSYRAETPEEYISCHTIYHETIPALVCRGNIFGAQFHPEKSGEAGLSILKNFARLVKA